MGVQRYVCAPRLHVRERGGIRRDNSITSQNQICLGDVYLGCTKCGRTLCNLYMAPGRTTFLRQASGVLRDDSFAFNMRSHTQELPDGDDTRAADTGHDNTIGRLATWQYWFR